MPKPIHKCFKCHQTFSELYQLQDHIRRHENVTAQQSEEKKEENKQQICPSEMDGSEQDTSDDDDSICIFCGKTFSRSYLTIHLRTHTQQKRFECQHCGKGFGSKQNLQQHIQTHTGDKPYKCQHCGKGFRNSGHLKDTFERTLETNHTNANTAWI